MKEQEKNQRYMYDAIFPGSVFWYPGQYCLKLQDGKRFNLQTGEIGSIAGMMNKVCVYYPDATLYLGP